MKNEIKAIVTSSIAALALLVGAATAQVELTTFATGDPIVADQVNQNFSNLADGVTQNAARLDAMESGTVWVSSLEMVPLYTFNILDVDSTADLEYMREKEDALFLIRAANSSGDLYCFGARVRLPQGATVTSFAASMYLQSTSDAAYSQLLLRPWGSDRTESMALHEWSTTTSSSYVEMTTSSITGATVDNATNEYRVETCLSGDSRFLDARIEYSLP